MISSCTALKRGTSAAGMVTAAVAVVITELRDMILSSLVRPTSLTWDRQEQHALLAWGTSVGA